MPSRRRNTSVADYAFLAILLAFIAAIVSGGIILEAWLLWYPLKRLNRENPRVPIALLGILAIMGSTLAALYQVLKYDQPQVIDRITETTWIVATIGLAVYLIGVFAAYSYQPPRAATHVNETQSSTVNVEGLSIAPPTNHGTTLPQVMSDEKLAGKMSLYAPPGYRAHLRRILYIGKATSGAFAEPKASEIYFKGRSRFWKFAQALSKVADPNCEELSNLAWSNIFKQGVKVGNPSGAIAASQMESAALELREEVNSLQPSLIVLVNAGYYEPVVKAAFKITDNHYYKPSDLTYSETGLLRIPVGEDRKQYDLWFRPQYQEFPPILWMNHPQGKSTAYKEAALKLVRTRMGWD